MTGALFDASSDPPHPTPSPFTHSPTTTLASLSTVRPAAPSRSRYSSPRPQTSTSCWAFSSRRRCRPAMAEGSEANGGRWRGGRAAALGVKVPRPDVDPNPNPDPARGWSLLSQFPTEGEDTRGGRQNQGWGGRGWGWSRPPASPVPRSARGGNLGWKRYRALRALFLMRSGVMWQHPYTTPVYDKLQSSRFAGWGFPEPSVCTALPGDFPLAKKTAASELGALVCSPPCSPASITSPVSVTSPASQHQPLGDRNTSHRTRYSGRP